MEEVLTNLVDRNSGEAENRVMGKCVWEKELTEYMKEILHR